MKLFCIKQQSWTCKHKKHLHPHSDPFKAIYVYVTVAHFETNTVKEFQKLSFYGVILTLFCIWNWPSVFSIKTKQGKNLPVLLQIIFSFNVFLSSRDKVFQRFPEHIITELDSCKINYPIWFSSIDSQGDALVYLRAGDGIFLAQKIIRVGKRRTNAEWGAEWGKGSPVRIKIRCLGF